MHMVMQLLCLFVILQLCVEGFGACLAAIRNDKHASAVFDPTVKGWQQHRPFISSTVL